MMTLKEIINIFGISIFEEKIGKKIYIITPDGYFVNQVTVVYNEHSKNELYRFGFLFNNDNPALEYNFVTIKDILDYFIALGEFPSACDLDVKIKSSGKSLFLLNNAEFN